LLFFDRIFLTEKQGDPHVLNKSKQNLIHPTCQGFKDLVQYECLNILIQLNVDLNANDEYLNTPLHYAALNNHSLCVQLLIDNGACLFAENKDNQTPCDLAGKFGQYDMALLLESKMLLNVSQENKLLNRQFNPLMTIKRTTTNLKQKM
jgi:ankyrin repeat protein